jgi:hypothetical protein
VTRRPSRLTHLKGPFTSGPVVVLSVYAEADLCHVASVLRQDEWAVREMVRSYVSRHGEDLLHADRILFDRWSAIVKTVDVVYDIFPDDTIMIVALSA